MGSLCFYEISTGDNPLTVSVRFETFPVSTQIPSDSVKPSSLRVNLCIGIRYTNFL